MRELFAVVGTAIYAIGAAVVGARLLAAGIREGWRWLVRNRPRRLRDGLAVVVATPPLAILLLTATAFLMMFWPIVLAFTLQRRHQRRRLARFDDREREAELFREVREAARNEPLVLVLACFVAGACGDPEPPPEPDPAVDAARIMAGAARALGVEDPGAVHVRSVANVEGPDGSAFTTTIHSAADGRVRMAQPENGLLAGVGRSGGWRWDSGGGAAELGELHAFVRGHELHILALAPATRLHEASVRAATEWDGRPAWPVEARLDTGEELVAYYATADTTPLGLLVRYTDPPVPVTWSDWTEADGMRLFQRATFVQGADTFTYRYRDLAVGPLPDSVFEAPAGR